MKYTGLVDFDFLTLIQILAMAEEPAGIEFYDESVNFLGIIYTCKGYLKGAAYKDLIGVPAFVELVVSQSKSGGTFRKVEYVEPDEKIATNARIDALLLTAIADKETEEGQYQSSEYASNLIIGSNVQSSFGSARADGFENESVIETIDTQLRKILIPNEFFHYNSRHVSSVFSLFNMESILIFKEVPGHLIIFSEKYWSSLFPEVDPDTTDELSIQTCTCGIMADITRRYLYKKIPNFDATVLKSEDLLEQVDLAMLEATQDEEEVKITQITPGESYDEHMSFVSGFSETTLKEPNTQLEQLYKWLDNKLKRASAPLRYMFYPEKGVQNTSSKKAGPFRIVIACESELCNKLCANINHYLGSDNIVIYSITTAAEFESVERSDWEDCHLAILNHSLVKPDIYTVLDKIPETMSICLISRSKARYRPYLGAPIFRERVQGIYSPENHDLAKLISTIFEIATFQIES